MTQTKRNKYIKASILLSLVSIIFTAIINSQIANAYINSDGKTIALFGLKELLQFGYQYYVVVLGMTSIIFAILSLKGENKNKDQAIAFALAILAITIVFVKSWRLLI